MLRANRCVGSGQLVAVPAVNLTVEGGWGVAVCPVCGMEAEPVHVSVQRLKRIYVHFFGERFDRQSVMFPAGSWVGKVRIHRGAPETDWSRE